MKKSLRHSMADNGRVAEKPRKRSVSNPVSRVRTEIRVDEKSKEINCRTLGLKYRSDMIRITEILSSPEGQTELEKHCDSTATKFKEVLAKIGEHAPAAISAAIAMDFFRGGLR